MFRPLLTILLALGLATAGLADTDCADYAGGLRCIGSAEVPAYPSGSVSPAGYDDFVVKGGTVYAFQSHVGLRVIDIDDPADPVARGSFPLEQYEHARLTAIDHYVVVLLGSAIVIIDVDDADAPSYATHLFLPGQPQDLVLLDDRLLLVAGGDAGLVLVDLDDPAVPQIVDQFDLGLPVECLARDGDTVAAMAAGTMLVIDVAVPSWPVVRGSLAVGGATGDLALGLEGDLVVVGRRFTSTFVDIGDPQAPVLLGELPVGGYGAAIIDGVAYLSSRFSYEIPDGLYLYDVQSGRPDRFDPQLLNWIPMPQGTHGHQLIPGTDLVVSITQGGHVTSEDRLGLQVFERAGYGTAPPPTGVVVNPQVETRYEAVFVGSYCYIGKGDDLGVCDVSDVTAPVYLQDIPSGIECLDASGGFLFTAYEIMFGDNRFHSWSLADPANPIQVDLLVTENYRPIDLKVHQGAMYVTRHDGGLEINDVRDPAAMATVTAQWPSAQALNQIRILDGELWIGGAVGLFRVDTTDPFAPEILEVYPARGDLHQVVWDGERRLAFVVDHPANQPDAWEIWDVTDTATATRLARVEQPCYWESTIVDVRWHDDAVYVASMMTVDLYRWDGTGEPQHLAFIPEGPDSPTGPGSRLSLQIHAGNLVVFGGHDVELRLWPLQCPATPTGAPAVEPPAAVGPVLLAAPNPFNPRTTFTLVGSPGSPLAVEIFDPRGRRVRTLEGVDSAVWDGRDGRGRELPAGVYLARVKRPQGDAVSRVVLVR